MKYLPIVISIAACLAVGELSSLLQKAMLFSQGIPLDNWFLRPRCGLRGCVGSAVYSDGRFHRPRGTAQAPDCKMVTGLVVEPTRANFLERRLVFSTARGPA